MVHTQWPLTVTILQMILGKTEELQEYKPLQTSTHQDRPFYWLVKGQLLFHNSHPGDMVKPQTSTNVYLYCTSAQNLSTAHALRPSMTQHADNQLPRKAYIIYTPPQRATLHTYLPRRRMRNVCMYQKCIHAYACTYTRKATVRKYLPEG